MSERSRSNTGTALDAVRLLWGTLLHKPFLLRSLERRNGPGEIVIVRAATWAGVLLRWLQLLPICQLLMNDTLLLQQSLLQLASITAGRGVLRRWRRVQR